MIISYIYMIVEVTVFCKTNQSTDPFLPVQVKIILMHYSETPGIWLVLLL